jgi:hypothetical protein
MAVESSLGQNFGIFRSWFDDERESLKGPSVALPIGPRKRISRRGEHGKRIFRSAPLVME